MPNPKGLNVRKMPNGRLTWRGPQVRDAVMGAVAQAWSEIGLRVETEAKKELYKGHGVVTGTLRRSIHAAEPGYNWRGDDAAPSTNTPERGGQMVMPLIQNNQLVTQVGSGLNYALPVHQGNGNGFEGYHYLRNGITKVKPAIPDVLRKYRLGIRR